METETVKSTENLERMKTSDTLESLEIRRRGALSAGVASVAGLVATAYFARAASTGAVLDWVLCGGLAALAVAHVVMFLDARAPLLVADGHGVRVRAGRIWRGIPWSGLESVRHRPRRGPWRDGRLELVPRGDESELGVRLGLATRVVGAEDGLTETLERLANGQTEVEDASEPGERSEPGEASSRPSAEKPAIAAPASGPTEYTVVLPDLASVPTVEPKIGPELAAARRRLRLTVDALAERTRIRPHVIEAIEIDDFGPCGGDFYARGHLRTLARVVGVDVTPLLETYDKQYADAPIDPRCVFEAELSTAGRGPIRGVRGGPNWSVLVAAVMALVLCWSIARLVMDGPVAVTAAPPSLADGSAGLTSGGQLAPKVPVVLTAAGGGARVILRDGGGKVVFNGSLAFGQSHTFSVSPPVRVQSTDGSLEVTVDGAAQGALGRTGQPAQEVFTAR